MMEQLLYRKNKERMVHSMKRLIVSILAVLFTVCISTSAMAKIIVDPDYTGNLRPKAENEGRNNLTPTLVYGHVTFVLYNSNGTVNTEVTVNVYCNQKGTTWIERQG